ncbi:phosphoribosylaminoimidazole-succinocarboxamide synthase [Paucilactobacillus vaccinostercus DSM 20634]|jgi:phosphoribosylaminoimidazole-succinocarboxamide synthase|uniref:Phosphoribosylaminoimidazole-succinocarboxamide synthase n=1 Tax=Paucilactobacillus vaccinostercus DSM 20634 TaxID=1423813 RepID=A0A0R2A3R9_9LACO|nr:phosphoribosylaminoimidazolesuccinocarboxamide synthase [Paucilactobacillus vaccinostercus]KRM61661.1 phosphoribosylaminoimidazole-succinocarboxamide synthase [Paucilactobacillus vaccinostercus DSM 20634]RRG10678.1 MAG: phosphoribosylaminoimidazolesuccinocarboxamide synthase [Lactobacillus sp.]
MEKGTLIKEGKAKRLYHTDEDGYVWVEYMDQATALNGKRKDHIVGKGVLNNQIDTMLFKMLMDNGIHTDFVKQLSDNEQLNLTVDIIPLEVVVRNAASGSFQRKFAVPYLQKFDHPVVEYFYKSDELDDPAINTSQALALGVIKPGESERLQELALQINDLLKARFAKAGLELVDFKVEFGKKADGEIILADEISPDSCRLVDLETRDSFDKDVFRKKTGDLVTTYQEVLNRLNDSQEEA